MAPEAMPAPGGSVAAGAPVLLPLARLRPGPSVRERLDTEHVVALACALDRVPPILVRADTYEVVDGAHRVAAARHRGYEHIGAVLLDLGDEHAALAAHIRANAAHGLALTTSERRAAAKQLLAGDPARSDRAVARWCGLSPTTVGSVRRQAVEDGEVPEVATRRGRDGKEYPAPDDGEQPAAALPASRGWWRQLPTRLRAFLGRVVRFLARRSWSVLPQQPDGQRRQPPLASPTPTDGVGERTI